ncbi:UDP-glucose--hexose-1-phosphate uridylyltransferase [Anaerotignum faecicola]|nr:UDP-glucose--hexose-1-phosphate uridylyltransferase [Anaerotignum faecicola]
MINAAIKALAGYGLTTGLIRESDVIYIINGFISLLGMDSYEESHVSLEDTSLENVLKIITDYAVEKGIIEDTVTQRDLFDTKFMGVMTPRPSDVISKFNAMYDKGAQMATDWYYKFSCDTDYIRRYRIEKDIRWVTSTEYGDLDITINMSKPEKDPRDIAAAKNAPQSGYPKCMLCAENEGYAGSINHPARQNHRIIPIKINGCKWFFQYSPYVYYNEHCIVFNSRHVPMKIEKDAFRKMLDFIKLFPHYFIGSNADLPIVGGSILSHDHFQGGRYTFAMEKAGIKRSFKIKGFGGVKAGIVNWPMSVIRLECGDDETLVEVSDKILTAWRAYTDEKAFVFAETDGTPHNTITPIARRKGERFQMDLVLRNNITTPEHPMGYYHPHEKLHHIKKENIGLIEVMGLAVLPARLKDELKTMETIILEGGDLKSNEKTAKHAVWAEEFLKKYDSVSKENISDIVEDEVGRVFMEVLEDAGVFKNNSEGQDAFWRFISFIGGEEEV